MPLEVILLLLLVVWLDNRIRQDPYISARYQNHVRLPIDSVRFLYQSGLVFLESPH